MQGSHIGNGRLIDLAKPPRDIDLHPPYGSSRSDLDPKDHRDTEPVRDTRVV
jgi:hypothetical protein